MRATFRAVALAVGVLAFSATCAHAQGQAATLTPAAGQAVQVVNGARVVAGGVLAGGYVLTSATLEFIGGVGIRVGWRIAGGAAVAAVAASSLAPLVLGGLAVGAGAAAISDWLDRAHAAGLAEALIFDSATGRVLRRGIPGSGYDQERTLTNSGQTIAQMYAQNSWIADSCANGCTTRIRPPPSYGCNNQFWEIVNSIGNQVTGWCLNATGAVLAGDSPPSVPTQSDWDTSAAQLANVPLSPSALQSMGKPIPVDPLPVINPPDVPNDDVLIGASNPAPVLGSRPQTIVGQATPVPGTTPQQYTQPTYVVTPAPTDTSPYSVIVVTNVVSTTDPAVPTTPTVPGTATPSTPDVCAHNPDAAMCQPLGTFTNPGMPPIPVLYERKYPDGLIGIWDQKKQAMRETAVAQLASQIMPSGIGDGGCPQWQIPLDVGFWDYGTVPIGIPCEYWAVLRVIMIIGSLFLARALIFGG